MLGHAWTVAPFLLKALTPAKPPASRHFVHAVSDELRGSVRLTGRLSAEPSDDLLLVVHGMGGNAMAPYVVRPAIVAHALGIASLRLNLRGADRRGEDFYHAGLTSDLHDLVASPELAAYARIHLLGFSLGGHIVLRFGAETVDPRVRTVAAVCPPVDLARGARAIDEPHRVLYRRKLLYNLKEVYRDVVVPIALDDALRIDRIWTWDDRVVAPRFGFASAADYYERVSVGPLLDSTRIPTLVVQAIRDPMILAHTVRPHLERSPRVTTVWVDRGGHIGFPRDLDLGIEGPRGIDAQILAWMLAQRRPKATSQPVELRSAG
jgi:predicted alpha/beta-fold hydrolase